MFPYFFLVSGLLKKILYISYVMILAATITILLAYGSFQILWMLFERNRNTVIALLAVFLLYIAPLISAIVIFLCLCNKFISKEKPYVPAEPNPSNPGYQHIETTQITAH